MLRETLNTQKVLSKYLLSLVYYCLHCFYEGFRGGYSLMELFWSSEALLRAHKA